MRILIVYAHPALDSYLASVLAELTQALESKGHHLRVLDLYQEGFDPVLRLEAWRNHRAGRSTPGVLDDHIAALKAAEGLILVYPTWWYGMPAMLKGWFDRVWLPGVAFGLDEQRGITAHGLSRIERLMVVTTHGAPRWFIRLWMGDPGRKVVLRGFRPLLARGCRAAWLATYAMDVAKPLQLQRFRERVARSLRIFSD